MSDTPTKAMQICLDQIRAGKTRAWIGKEIGVSRPHVSRYLLGHYEDEGAAKIEAALIKRFDRRICPHDGEEKQPAQCLRIVLRPRPHGFPDAESLWVCCQICPHKPTPPEASK